MFQRVLSYLALILSLIIGIGNLYRASLNPSDMTIITGKVINKEIMRHVGTRSISYSLGFDLLNQKNRIRISLGSRGQAIVDTTFNLIEVSKIYTFYLDPTVPTRFGVNLGIRRIDYEGKPLYKQSKKLKIFCGLFFGFIGLIGILVLYYKRKSSTAANTLQ